jgi:HPt (histidine-containing phosphotransfer) domain-containing protein
MTPVPQQDQAVWEPGVLENLSRHMGGDDTLLCQLISIYLRQGRDLLDQLEAAAEDSDPEALREAAHALKGSTLTVGGCRLAAVCEAVERGQSDEWIVQGAAGVRREFDALAHQLELRLQAAERLGAGDDPDRPGEPAGPQVEDSLRAG